MTSGASGVGETVQTAAVIAIGSGLLGEENARVFVTGVGALALLVGGRLLLGPAGRRAATV